MVKIATEHIDQLLYIEVDGEVDAGSSIHLDNALKKALMEGEKKILVDLTKLRYISSAGLGVFISHLDEFEAEQVRLALYGVNETVQQVFDILGLEKLLTIKNSREEAIESLNEQ